jgi:hypothetical protein
MSNKQTALLAERIRARWDVLVGVLTNATILRRLSRPLLGVPVPEFWEDPHSAEEFIVSFSEYVAFRINDSRGPKRPAIVSHIVREFGLESGDQPMTVRHKIETKEGHFSNWPLQRAIVGEDDLDDDYELGP